MEPGYLQTNITDFFRGLTLLANFGFRFIKELFKRPFEFKEFIKQSYFLGNKSLLLIAITAFIMGLVLTVQTRPELAKFGAESWLPAMVAVSIVKEIGPVITAVIFAGKTGSGIGAELASMRVTEQVDAMEASGVNPFKYVVVTRMLATTLMLPLLVLFADAVALYGSFFGINLNSSINVHLLFN